VMDSLSLSLIPLILFIITHMYSSRISISTGRLQVYLHRPSTSSGILGTRLGPFAFSVTDDGRHASDGKNDAPIASLQDVVLLATCPRFSFADCHAPDSPLSRSSARQAIEDPLSILRSALGPESATPSTTPRFDDMGRIGRKKRKRLSRVNLPLLFSRPGMRGIVQREVTATSGFAPMLRGR
jgi:hypothetical protein